METGLQKTLKLLKKYEGFKDTVYLDGNGIPTIGYGFTDPALIKKGKITLKEADSRLTKEIATRYNTLKDTLPNFEKLSDDSKAALISYHFNYPAGFKDTTKFMKYWNAGDYEKAIKEVDAGMNDPKNPGLRPRRLEELAMLSSDPFISGIIATRKRDGNKILKFPVPEQKPFESTWKPEPPVKTIYPLNNTTPESISSWSGADAPNATPRLKDFLEVRQKDLNRGVDIYGDPVSPFSLRLRLPSLTSLLQLNNPLKLAELYFADALGISDMLPLTPSLFPRLKNGKLPKYEDGSTPADATWHENWLKGRQKQFDENVSKSYYHKYNPDLPSSTIDGLIGTLKLFREVEGLDKFKKLAPRYSFPELLNDDSTEGVTGQDDKVIGYNPLVINKFTGVEDNIDSVKIHERTHALGAALPQHKKIELINGKYGVPYLDENGNAIYRNDSGEIYAGLMEARKRLGLSPDYVVTEDDIRRWKEDGSLGMYLQDKPDAALLEYFNEVASNPNPLFNPNNIYTTFGPSEGKILYAKDGKTPIHIKSANRGKLTKLKKRTGKSEAELYRTGGPSVRKMITFARNARKWKH